MFAGLCNQCCVKDEASIVKVDMSSKIEESDPAPEPETKQREEEDAQKRQEEEEGQQPQQEKECKDTEDQKQRPEEVQAAPEAQAFPETQAAPEKQEATETQAATGEEPVRPQKEEDDRAEGLKQEKEQDKQEEEKEQEQAAAAPQSAPLPALLLDAQQQPAAEEKANEESELRKQLDAWLKKNGLANVNAKKKTLLPPSHCYPLHLAVKQKNAQMVRALVQFGADKNTPNSSGLKALELANKNKKGNSHDEIIAALS